MGILERASTIERSESEADKLERKAEETENEVNEQRAILRSINLPEDCNYIKASLESDTDNAVDNYVSDEIESPTKQLDSQIAEVENEAKEDNGVRSTLMRVNENIGINMITSTDENGTAKYTYEVVGITEDGHSVTDEERQVIFDAMSDMCFSEFKEFVRKLEKKGFVFNNLNDRSPNIRYCKNKHITDYSMHAEENYADEMYRTAETMNSHS